MAGRHRDTGPVKISVVGGGQRGSKIWRRERIEMTNDPDLDDCAFLSGKLVVKETARILVILLRCFSMSILMSQVKSV